MNKALIIMMTLLLAGASFAQGTVTPNMDAGTKALRLHGSFDNDHPLDYEVKVGAGYGYFFADNLEIALEVALTANDLITFYEIGGFAEYNFAGESPWVPFIGIGGFYVGAEVDDDYYNKSGADADTAVGKLGAGVKYFIRNDVAVSLRANYSFAADDLYTDDDGNAQDTNLTTVLGLRIYFD